MAKRRMFSLDVVDTDSFLEMPSTARLLYYDLGMRADDDGFINPMKVVRMTGATSDDLKILIAKQFAYVFDDGVIVLLHWLRNNKIDSTKYQPSIYYPRIKFLLKQKLYIEKLEPYRPKLAMRAKEKGPEKGPLKGPQYRLGKGSIVKSSKVSTNKEKIYKKEKILVYPERHHFEDDLGYTKAVQEWNEETSNNASVEVKTYGNPEVNKVLETWKEHYGLKPDGTVQGNRYAASRLIKLFGLQKVSHAISYAASVRTERYAPSIHSFMDLDKKFSQLITYHQKNQSNLADYAAMESATV